MDECYPVEETTGPTENETVPTEGEAVPTEGETTPAGDENVPTEGETTPIEDEDEPTEGETIPAEDENDPTEGETMPAEDEKEPAEGETVPAEDENAPTEGETMPAEDEKEPTEGETVPAETVPAEETTPAGDGTISAEVEETAPVYLSEEPTVVARGSGWVITEQDGIQTMTVYSMRDGAYYEYSWYNYKSNVSRIVINDGVTFIGRDAFFSFPKLTEVEIADSVREIHEWAFAYCQNLVSVKLPKNLTTIDTEAFFICTKLSSIELPTGLTTIGAGAFDGCKLTSITIPEGVTSIGAEAFISNELKTVIIPDSVKTLGAGAFSYCQELTSVTIGSGVVTCGTQSFNGCNKLTDVTLRTTTEGMLSGCKAPIHVVIDEGVTNISDKTFYNCSNLQSVTFPDGVTTIGESAFNNCSSLQSVTIPDGVTTIGESAFNNCGSLQSVTIPSGITTIGKNTFYSCGSLQEVILPDSVTSIESAAFCYCSNLEKLKMPTGYVTIGDRAFYGCSKLGETREDMHSGIFYIDDNQTVYLIENGTAYYLYSPQTGFVAPPTIPTEANDGTAYPVYSSGLPVATYKDGAITWLLYGKTDDYKLLVIGNGAIPDSSAPLRDYRSGVKEIEIAETITGIGDYAFAGCSAVTTVEIPRSTTVVSPTAFRDCSSLRAFTVAEGNETFSASGGILYNSDQTTLILCPPAKRTAKNIPETVVTIGNNAFSYNSALSTVVLPKGLNTIEEYAFSECDGLTVITIPGNAVSVGANAFYGCDNLSEVTFETAPSKVFEHAFEDCTAVTSLAIPAGYMELYDDAFKNCGEAPLNGADAGLHYLDEQGALYWILDGYAYYIGCPTSVTDYKLLSKTPQIGEYGPYYVDVELSDFTDYGVIDELYWYIIDEGDSRILVITGKGAIPDYNYNTGAPWFEYSDTITDVIIESGVTAIGKYVFYQYPKITNVAISEGMTSIGYASFCGCPNLVNVAWTNSLTTIGERAFEECTSLISAHIPEGVTTIGKYAFENCTGLVSVTIPGTVESIQGAAFYRCTSLTDLIIGEGVKSIGSSAFSGCVALESVVIPESVTSIESSTFSSCSALESVVIPGSVTSIGSNAFSGCKALTSVTIPGSASIGPSAFENCNGLTDLTISEGVVTVGNYAFAGCSSLTDVVIPSTVEELEWSAFRNCTGLKSVIILPNLRINSYGVFYGCTNLTSVTLPEGYTYVLTDDAFGGTGCAYLYGTIYTDSNDVQYRILNSKAYVVYCPEAVTEDLIPDTIPNEDNSGTYPVITDFTTEEKGYFGDNIYWEIIEADGQIVLNLSGTGRMEHCRVGVPGTGYNYEVPPWAMYNDVIDQVVIGEGITSIGNGVFQNTGLTSVSIPESVTSIGIKAFSGCKALTSVTISENVTSIGMNAFYDCSALTSVIIPEGYFFFEENVFYGTDFVHLNGTIYKGNNGVQYRVIEGLAYVAYLPDTVSMEQVDDYIPVEVEGSEDTYPVIKDHIVIDGGVDGNIQWLVVQEDGKQILLISGSGEMQNYSTTNSYSLIAAPWINYRSTIEKAIISEGITSIGNCAFYNCTNMEEIIIPDSVTQIGVSAFYYCRNLAEVTITEGVTDIPSNAFNYCSRLTTIHLQAADLKTVYTDYNNHAFRNCPNINLISVEPGVDTLYPILFTATKWSSSKYPQSLFVGPNHFTVDFSFTTGILSSLGTPANLMVPGGSYYVDAQGVIYQIADGTATVLYVPAGVQEYTIPGMILAADEGEETVPVVGVGTGALEGASDLVTLVFESPETITSLADYALANCPTLLSVNGETKASAAKALFTNENIQIGEGVLANTGLLSEMDEMLSGMTVTANEITAAGADIMLKVYSSADTNSSTEGDRTFYTGQYAQIRMEMSNTDSDSAEVVRLYLHFSSEKGFFPLDVGTHERTDDKSGYTYQFTVNKLTDSNTYYIDIPAIASHATITPAWDCMFPTPDSGGGTLSIWAEILNGGESGDTVQNNEYLQLTWITQPDDFNLTKVLASNPVVRGDGSEAGLISVRSLVFRIEQKAANDRGTLGAYGRDHMTQVDFADVLTLPVDLTWADGVTEAIRSGAWTSRIYKVNNKNIGYEFVVTVNEEEKTLFRVANTGIFDMKLWVTEDEKIGVGWSYKNSNVQKEMVNLSFLLEVADGMIVGHTVKEFTQVEEFPLINEVTATQHFAYSADQIDTAKCEYTVASTAAEMILTKSYERNTAYYGEEYPYTITMVNHGAQHLESVDQISDVLLRELYISPDNMFTMFTGHPEGKNLTVTINNATIYKALTGDTSVTGTSGLTFELTIQNTSGAGTLYDGDEEFDIADNFIYQDSATLVLQKAGDGVSVTLNGGETKIAANAEELQQKLYDLGYFVTPSAQYTVEWNYPDGMPLWSGETREFEILTTVKDAFMQISKDHAYGPIIKNASPAESTGMNPNSVTVKYRVNQTDTAELTKETSAETKKTTLHRDFTLEQALYKDGILLEENDVVEGGGIVDLRLTVTHKGDASYDMVPLVDYMEGAQVLMVRAADNPHLANDYGLKAQTIGGIDYFLLDQTNTYPNVMIDGYLAHSITVTKSENNPNYLNTMIRWYLTGISGNTTKQIDLKLMLTTAGEPTEESVLAVDNEAWLNDHQAHRLWEAFGSHWTFTTFEKHIVTNHEIGTDVHDVLNEDGFTVIKEGESVTYRLDLSGLVSVDSVQAGKTVTIPGTILFDKLPACLPRDPETGYGGWTISDLEYVYDPEKVDLDNPGEWELTWTDPLTQKTYDDQQFIVWKDLFKITYKETADVYVYVTLTYPSGANWAKYCNTYGSTMLENALYFSGDFKSVRHSLSLTGSGMLVKGVNSTGVWNGNQYYPSSEYNSRFAYSTEDGMQRLVTYYIALYNDGATRLYLDDIQDQIPEGFAYRNGSVSQAGKYAIVTDADSVDVTYKKAVIGVSTDDETGNLRFAATNGSEVSEGVYQGDLSYDSVYEKYYLLPHEALVFTYQCLTGVDERTTDQIINNEQKINTAAMPYFDYNLGGVVKGDSSVAGSSEIGTQKNDGESRILNNTEACGYDFVTPYDGATEWLSSQVYVERGDVEPGISKQVIAVQMPNTPEATGSTTQAQYEAFVTWEITSYNTGTTPMRDYVLTDVMEQEYIFDSDVNYTVRYGDYYNVDDLVITDKLFSITELTTAENKNAATGAYMKTFEHKKFGKLEVSYMPSTKEAPSTLAIHFMDAAAAIPEGGRSELTVVTRNGSNNRRNATYTNTGYITPSQSWLESEVEIGNPVIFNGKASVSSSAQIMVADYFITSSSKSVTEKNNPNNTTNSNEKDRAIVLPSGEDLFTYKLEVTNTGNEAEVMEKFVIIDTLPTENDHNVLRNDQPRESAFQVDLADKPNFVIKVGGKTLESSEYTIQYSDRIDFTDDADHLHGISDDGWYDTPTDKTRSFRIILTGSMAEDGTVTGTPVCGNTVVSVEFDAKIHGADLTNGNVLPGETAWNSFAYYYVLQNDNSENKVDLAAAPLKVGVKMPSAPWLVKQLKTPDGVAWSAEDEEVFSYVIFKQSDSVDLTKLGGLTEEEIGDMLSKAGAAFTRVSLTVPKGASESEGLMLKDQHQWSFAEGVWIEGIESWTWEDDAAYIFCELPIENESDYAFGALEDIRENCYCYVHDWADETTIVSVNIRKVWNINLMKVSDDVQNHALAGAWFGLYGPEQPAEEVVIPEGVTADVAQTLTYTAEDDMEQTYYLLDVRVSGSDGIILWNNLMHPQYLVQEIQAPEGYHYDDTIHLVQRPDNVILNTRDITVVNRCGYEMPKSGGIGTHWITLAGILLIMVSGVMLLTDKRRRYNVQR